MIDIVKEELIDAPVSAVWHVLLDFGEIHRWSPGVHRSFLVTSGPVSVGTTRHCDFTPIGSAKERIVALVPEKNLSVVLSDIRKMPFSAAEASFSLTAFSGQTKLTLNYRCDPVGPFKLLGKPLQRMLGSGLTKLVAGLKDESEKLALEH